MCKYNLTLFQVSTPVMALYSVIIAASVSVGQGLVIVPTLALQDQRAKHVGELTIKNPAF